MLPFVLHCSYAWSRRSSPVPTRLGGHLPPGSVFDVVITLSTVVLNAGDLPLLPVISTFMAYDSSQSQSDMFLLIMFPGWGAFIMFCYVFYLYNSGLFKGESLCSFLYIFLFMFALVL